MNVFIFGLPRSRTAWFSGLLNNIGTNCVHEGVNNCYTKNQYLKKIKEKSDSTTAFRYILENNIYPYRPRLIISKTLDKDLNKTKDFCLEHYGVDMQPDIDYLNNLHIRDCDLKVDYSEINDRLSEILKFITGFHVEKEVYEKYINQPITTSEPMNIDAARGLLSEANQQITD